MNGNHRKDGIIFFRASPSNKKSDKCILEPRDETNWVLRASDGEAKTKTMNIKAIEASEERIDGMDLRLDEHARIENPRDYSPRVIDGLLSLLRQGVQGRPDPRRENFYEVDGNQGTFYIYISPVNANVMLLAWWAHEPTARLTSSVSGAS